MEPKILAFICAYILLLYAYQKRLKIAKPTKRESALHLVFSLFLSLVFVMGYRITLSESVFFGSAFENYIAAYSVIDLIALASLCAGFYLVLTQLYLSLKKASQSKNKVIACDKPLNKTRIIVCALALFCAWIPYLLSYWPGLIFGDSISSISQACGFTALNNHHPVLYTLFIKVCLKVSHILGLGNTTGIAIYSVIQMAVLAGCFSFMANWITTRAQKGRLFLLFLISIPAFVPYLAIYSIAVWKDPIFSASLAMITILLADLLLSRGAIAKKPSWICGLLAWSFIAAFTRNNGLYILITIAIALGILLVAQRKQFISNALSRVLGILASVIISIIIITGPVYSLCGVTNADSKAETYGVLINQMARVVTMDGTLHPEDASYMNTLLPVEEFPKVYSPTLVDPIKWAPDFNASALDSGFLLHWFSILKDNPQLYFESWELNTCGFWIPNLPWVNSCTTNIAMGVPNIAGDFPESQLNDYDIHPINFLENTLFNVFPIDGWFIPIPWLFWLLLYLCVILALLRKGSWLIVLAPSLGLLATLIVASPIFYWPRYAIAIQFLIPVYFLLAYLAAYSNWNIPRENIDTLVPALRQ